MCLESHLSISFGCSERVTNRPRFRARSRHRRRRRRLLLHNGLGRRAHRPGGPVPMATTVRGYTYARDIIIDNLQ